jgi:hypothetical protein
MREKAVEKHLDHHDCLEVHVLQHEGEPIKAVVECVRCDEVIDVLWSKDEVDVGRTRQVALEPDAIRYRINKMRTGGLSMSEIEFQLNMDGVRMQHMLQLVLSIVDADPDPAPDDPIPFVPIEQTSEEVEEAATFMELLVDGEVDEEEIDHFVDVWHGTNGEETLHDFLGMRWDEYKRWAKDPSCLAEIAAERRRNRHENDEAFAIQLYNVYKCLYCDRVFVIEVGEEDVVCPRCGRG